MVVVFGSWLVAAMMEEMGQTGSTCLGENGQSLKVFRMWGRRGWKSQACARDSGLSIWMMLFITTGEAEYMECIVSPRVHMGKPYSPSGMKFRGGVFGR